MDTLIKNHNDAIIDFKKKTIYQRKIFSRFETSHRILGVVGLRGSGKTTFLLDHLTKNYPDSEQALFVSADQIYFRDNSLIDLARKFVYEKDGKMLYIDEIHRYPNWDQELKNIYDLYSDLKIIFSGSNAIDLIKQTHDLSRRAILEEMPALSFREYLEIKQIKKLPVVSLEKIIKNRSLLDDSIVGIPGLLGHFKNYLRSGEYPIFNSLEKEKDIFKALLGVIDKTIHVDIPACYEIKTSTLPVFKKILHFIHTSKPSRMNIHKLANSLKKNDENTLRYLNILADAGLLRFLLNDGVGHPFLRRPEKVFLANTSLAYALEYGLGKPAEIGANRELFVLNQMQNALLDPFYTKKGDIACKDYVFEIGGKNKTFKQIKDIKNGYLIKDEALFGDSKSIPLYMFGFLY